MPRNFFDCLRESVFNHSAQKCEFGPTKIDYLGSTISPKRISPKSAKIAKFFGQIRMPDTVKKVKHSIGFVHFFQNIIPNLGQKIFTFYKL